MAEADDDFLVRHAPADVRVGFLRRVVALLDLESDFVRSAVLGAAQGADRASDRRVHIGAGAGDYAPGEGRRVELMLGVENERRVHRTHPLPRRLLLMQQLQEMTADRIVLGLDLDPLACVAVVMPVHQHRAQACDQPIGDLAGAGDAVVVLLRQHAPQRRNTRTHDVHRMTRRRQLLEHRFHGRRQPPQARELRLVHGEFRAIRQFAVNQQMRDLLELTMLGDVEDVVTAVVQIVAAASHGAQRGVAGGDAGEGDRLLRLESSRCFTHALYSLASSPSSLSQDLNRWSTHDQRTLRRIPGLTELQ